MTSNCTALFILITASLLAACGDSPDEARDANSRDRDGITINKDVKISEEKAEDMIRGFTEAMTQFGEKVETVPAKELKEIMPVEIPGMTRTAYNASKKGMEGFSFSTASATFEEDSGPGVLELSVTDIGNVRGFAKFGLEMLDIEIDEENQDGFKRTERYKGYKSFQSSNKTYSGVESEMIVFVGDRLIVNANGQNLDWDLIEDVVDAIPLKKLEGMIK